MKMGVRFLGKKVTVISGNSRGRLCYIKKQILFSYKPTCPGVRHEA